jgi:monovalent cation:H+ antiporter-2, CPA2 family
MQGGISETSAAGEVEQIIEGLGSPVTLALPADCRAIGKSLGAINLRGLTGATVLAILRGDKVISVPAGNEMLFLEDILIIAGTRRAVEEARELLGMQ